MPRTLRALLLLVLLAAPAHAGNAAPSNLKGLTPCYTADNLQLDATTRTALGTDIATLNALISTKLRAYRIPSTCGLFAPDLWVQVDMAKNSSGLTVYTIVLDVYASTAAYPSLVSIYNIGTFGSTVQTGSALAGTLAGQLSTMLDGFAADYATANP